MTCFKAIFAALLCCTAFAEPALARDLTEDEAAEAMDFAMHDATYSVYHEIGHMMVDQLDLPVLGKEEDAADALAVILLLNDKSDRIEAYNTLVDSSDGWYFNALKSTGEGVEGLSYYDDHSLSIQRAYAMACMMVGSDPKEYAEIAKAYDFDEDQQEGCAATYEKTYASWMALLKPHAIKSVKKQISVVYDEAGDYQVYADELKSRQVLEKAAKLIQSLYKLPEKVTFHGALCGQANAYYSPDDNEVIYCYELAADMYALDVENIFADASAEPEAAPEADEEKAQPTGSSVTGAQRIPQGNFRLQPGI